MNLQETLNHRKKCLFCGNEMILQSNLPKFKTALTDEGVMVSNKNSKIFYYFNGSFQSYNMRKDHYKIMTFSKFCDSCTLNFKVPSDYGRSTMQDLLHTRCYYVFDVMTDPATKHYLSSINYDYVSTIQNNVLFQLETSYHLKESKVNYGSIFTAFSNMLMQTIPMVDIKSILNTDSLCNKIKLYAAFS